MNCNLRSGKIISDYLYHIILYTFAMMAFTAWQISTLYQEKMLIHLMANLNILKFLRGVNPTI